jgi:hypothetical protein
MIINNLEKKPSSPETIDTELRERIKDNFIFEIAEYLMKKEKIALREMSKEFEKEIFSQLQINIFLKKNSENDDFNHNNLDLMKILKFYQKMEKLRVESITLNEKNVELLEAIMKQNVNSLKILHLMNLDYQNYDYVERLFDVINQLKCLTEISFGGIGNRDRLILNIEKNNKELSFKNNIKVLKIDNLPLTQIQFLLDYFPKYSEITIENCSLDEDISQLTQKLTNKKLNKIHLPLNGFSSNVALDNIKTILHSQDNLTEISLKGIWFKSVYSLYTEFQIFSNLEKLDLSGSKYFFSEFGLESTIIFKHLTHLRSLDLSDCRMRTNNLESLLKNINPKLSDSLQELNLMKNLLNFECFNVLIENLNKINNLKTLNLGFNSQIGNKGFNIFAENCDKFKLNSIDLRGCGIFVKLAQNSFNNIMFKKKHELKRIEFYYNTLKDSDYEAFVKSTYSYLNSNVDVESLNLKIFFKFKSNLELQKKLEGELDFIYKRYNLVLR